MSTLPVRNLMHQMIGVSHIVMKDDDFYHQKTYSAFTNAPARIEVSPGRSFGQNGEDIATYATIYTKAEVNEMDRIAMPDGTVRQVLSVSRQVDRTGKFSHSEVRV